MKHNGEKFDDPGLPVCSYPLLSDLIRVKNVFRKVIQSEH
jgi:hypothetical protein